MEEYYFHRVSERIVHEGNVLSTLLIIKHGYRKLPKDFSPDWFEDHNHKALFIIFQEAFITPQRPSNVFKFIKVVCPELQPLVAELTNLDIPCFPEDELAGEAEKLRVHRLLPEDPDHDGAGLESEGKQESSTGDTAPSLPVQSPGQSRDIQEQSLRLTDLGNSERFVTLHGGDVLYDHKSGKWFLWNGRHWEKDEEGRVVELGKETVRGIYGEAESAGTSYERRDLARHAILSESRTRINNMLELAKTAPGVSITPDRLDTDRYLLNLVNGTYDLHADHLRPHSSEDHITKITEVSFDPAAQAPEWERFIRKIFNDDVELIRFLQRCVGYSLTGDVSEQCLFFAYGTGKNGKTVFFEVLKLIFGDYWQKAPAEMLMLRKNEGIPNDVARLQGARFVVASEIQEGRWLNEAKLKDLTGGDTITARYLHQEFFQFSPTHKLWIFGNHKPNIRGTDDGIWRRIMLIPFAVTISENERIPMSELIATMRGELPGILNWALDGYRDYLKRGLSPPELVRAATDTYREEMDLIGEFIEERCLVTDGAAVLVKDMYAAYGKWCIDRNEYPLKLRQFNERIREHGYTSKPGRSNYLRWDRLGLLDI
jgi:putative DNA primase/helicase